MEDVMGWIIWAVVIGGGIISSIAKARKKAKEAAGAGRGVGAGEGGAAPAGTGRGASAPEPVATSYDYYSLEDDYDGTDGRGRRPEYNAESTLSTLRSGVLNAADARTVSTAPMGSRPGVRTVSSVSGTLKPGMSGAVVAENEDPSKAHDEGASAIAEILGGEFDLRRAVIEAEILTPKYLQR